MVEGEVAEVDSCQRVPSHSTIRPLLSTATWENEGKWRNRWHRQVFGAALKTHVGERLNWGSEN